MEPALALPCLIRASTNGATLVDQRCRLLDISLVPRLLIAAFKSEAAIKSLGATLVGRLGEVITALIIATSRFVD